MVPTDIRYDGAMSELGSFASLSVASSFCASASFSLIMRLR